MAKGKLCDRYIVPPFSVLDARQGYWRARKREWASLGVQGDEGRGGLQTYNDKSLRAIKEITTSKASVFDPVLAECIYTWFAFPGARVLDPFAGGAVRGVVAHMLGLTYTGIEMRAEQIRANVRQARAMGVPCAAGKAGRAPTAKRRIVRWIEGDAFDVADLAPGTYDIVFSCPPYFNLEVYSQLPGDLSAYKTYRQFLERYRAIISSCVGMLAPNRFASFVVADVRDTRGFYRCLVVDTIAAFLDAGMRLYNEAILVTACGSLPLRVAYQFPKGRKLGKAHQNVLVFYQGDPSAMKTEFPEMAKCDLATAAARLLKGAAKPSRRTPNPHARRR